MFYDALAWRDLEIPSSYFFVRKLGIRRRLKKSPRKETLVNLWAACLEYGGMYSNPKVQEGTRYETSSRRNGDEESRTPVQNVIQFQR